MRYLSACHILTSTLCLWFSASAKAQALDVRATKVHGPWIDSRPYLAETKPEEAQLIIPLVENFHQALMKGLRNVEHQRTVLKLQEETGTQLQTFGEGWLLKNKSIRAADANATHATRWALFRNAKTYSGKEIKVDIVPEKIKKGFRFDQSAPKEGPIVSTITGTPVKYGLILKNIEPSDGKLKVAALTRDMDSEYAYFQNAPKADVQYEIGPIALTPAPQTYNFSPAPEPVEPKFDWKEYVPDHRFRGKFSPRSMPTAAKPIPDQTLTLEQVEGYYSTEIQFVNGFHKESMVHRFSIPVYKDLRLYEEYNEDFKPIKFVISNAYGNGFYSNLEHFFLEKRYRAGLFYRVGYTNLEIYANLPDTALNPGWKKAQTWELNLLTAL
ncbi:MAG: hypothetical protein EOP04_13505 [Proteobacteria bacterium]|nr:MAG: hypothetical protein EOP04_13505 [Pseudomonadota bacterium]